MKVYLDDIREAPIGWDLVRTVPEVIDRLRTGEVTHLSLDHDLTIEQTLGKEDGELTGYDVLLWLEKEVTAGRFGKLPKMSVHSMNPSGKARMLKAIESIKARQP